MNAKPNIVVIMTDQQRPDSIGIYGSDIAITPNIDALGRNGAVFDNMYVQSPLCVPSRYSMLTGRYPYAVGVRTNWDGHPEGEISFGEVLGRAGYRTAIAGKMHLTPWHDRFGFDGRIIAEAKFQTNVDDDYARYLRKHGYARTQMYDRQSKDYIDNATAVDSNIPQEHHIDTFVGLSACEYIKNADAAQPFCLVASFLSPHNPYDPPAPYNTLFDDVKMPARVMGSDEVQEKPREAYEYINRTLGWPYKTDELTDAQIEKTKRCYYALCTLVDDWVGQIVDALREKGVLDDTIIIYTSDHGDLLGDHGLVYKQCFYEQSARVPFIVHWPKRIAPSRIGDLAEMVDLFPTLCTFAGASFGHKVHGRPLQQLLERRENHLHREAAFSETHFGKMVRWRNYKLVYYNGKPYGELYDLATDPDELVNLWESAEHGGARSNMKMLLLDWVCGDESDFAAPVRSGPFDNTPRDLQRSGGRAVPREWQSWYVNELADLYRDWVFSRSGKLR